MLNINRLRLLREVANRKTIAATADAFFMTPSAVSQQLGVLEREAGVPLLKKSGRNVELTSAGNRLVKTSEEIFAAIARAEAELVDSSKGLSGSVKMSAFPTSQRALVVPSVVSLQKNHPNLHLHIQDLEPEYSLPMLGAGDLDIVVYYEWNVLPTIPAKGVQTYQLVTESVYLGMPAQHHLADVRRSINIAELSDENWIVGRESTSMLQFVSAATAQAGFSPRASFQSMDFDVILAAVEAGLGIALVPPLAFMETTSNKKKVVYKSLAELHLHRSTKVAVRKGSEFNPLTEEVRTTLQSQAQSVQYQLHVLHNSLKENFLYKR